MTQEWIKPLQSRTRLCWINPALGHADSVLPSLRLQQKDVSAAADLLQRWAPALANLFPELEPADGLIESPLLELTQAAHIVGPGIDGRVLLKADHRLPVAGSIKARGGVYEVLTLADRLAREHGVPLTDTANRLNPALRSLCERYTVSVASTGNLGLSIGIIASALGFRAKVHMSRIAKEWKKARLRSRGVEVVEHAGDFSEAAAAGRAQATSQWDYFVDDEASEHLFLGYSVAAARLHGQLERMQIQPGPQRPLFVYLPCGVGGAPGGITFGLKQLFGDHVHCFLVEPCAAPAMLAGLAAPDRNLSVYDIGLDNVTEADGLAVPRASRLVLELVRELIAGVMTIEDDMLFRYVHRLDRWAGCQVEPSAAASMIGPGMLCHTEAGRRYLAQRGLAPYLDQAVHVLWTTGGSFVPQDELDGFIARGRLLETQAEAPRR